MTNEELIAKLNHKCDISDIAAWLEWEWSHPQWLELSTEPQFKDWFSKAFNEEGYSETDEHYAYCGETSGCSGCQGMGRHAARITSFCKEDFSCV